jgi:hypothetical protein
MKWRTEDGGWSPYLAGTLAGLLAVASAWATTAVMGKTSYLGTSTTFVRAAGLPERTVAPDRVAGMSISGSKKRWRIGSSCWSSGLLRVRWSHRSLTRVPQLGFSCGLKSVNCNQ